MKTKKLLLMAAMLLMSVCSFAQNNNTPLKGDVNGDGKVDYNDVLAVLKIMKEAGGTKEATTYYWYVGQTDPSTMTSISPIVTDNSSPGWRLIGTTLPTYSSSNKLWDGATNNISFGGRTEYYIVLPNNSLKLYNSGGDNEMDGYTSLGTRDINNVTYYIYKCNTKAAAFGFNIY
jgi:hypothetical protein